VPRTTPDEPYKSAFDLPSFRKIQQDLKAARVFSLFAGRDTRKKFEEVERSYRLFGETVDKFYAVLGPRNWVFHDRLSPDKVRALLSDASPEEAERAFIELHKDGDWLAFWAQRATRAPDLAPWREMVSHALADYGAERYYSTTMTLLAVMDGFVNDLDKGRRQGLHTREAEDMKSWDSVTGHHMGLTKVIPVIFRRITAPITEPVTEVYRNGIMHGTVSNFNNDIVATKAWNYFFSILDWAADKQKQTEPEPPPPNFRDMLTKMSDNAKEKRALSEWKGGTLEPSDEAWGNNSLVKTVTSFLESWQDKNYVRLTQSLQASSKKRLGKLAPRRMREQFSPHPIQGFAVEKVEFVAAAIGVVSATVQTDGGPAHISMRWVSETKGGDVRVAGLPDAAWRRVLDGCPL
jgi:hypothetical protein